MKNINKVDGNNKISRYSLIGISNISSSYVQSISNMGLIDKNKEREYAINIIENKQKLVFALFSTPCIAEFFLKHFQKTKSSIIHTKYIFELSKYISEGDKELEVATSGDGDDEKKKSKKNIFNDIKNIMNNKIKVHIKNIHSMLESIKQIEKLDDHREACEALGKEFTYLHLNENIIKDAYTEFILKKAEFENKKNKLLINPIIGINYSEYYSKYKKIKEYYKNILLYTERMVLSNLRLVISVSKKYVNKKIDFMDIVQEGNLGLVKAIKKFDYTRGYKFSTYATWWIKQAITRDMYEKSDAVRYPIHMKENISKVFKNINLIKENLSYEEKIKEVAKYTSLDEKKIRKVFKIQRGYINIDKSGSDFNDEDIADTADHQTYLTPYQLIVTKDKRRIIEELIKDLNDREKDIFKLRYMDHKYHFDKEMTLEMIGYLKGITRERVRQIIHKIITKLLNNKTNKQYANVLFA